MGNATNYEFVSLKDHDNCIAHTVVDDDYGEECLDWFEDPAPSDPPKVQPEVSVIGEYFSTECNVTACNKKMVPMRSSEALLRCFMFVLRLRHHNMRCKS